MNNAPSRYLGVVTLPDGWPYLVRTATPRTALPPVRGQAGALSTPAAPLGDRADAPLPRERAAERGT